MLGTLPPGLDTDDIAHEDDPNDEFDVKIKPEPMEEAMPGEHLVLSYHWNEILGSYQSINLLKNCWKLYKVSFPPNQMTLNKLHISKASSKTPISVSPVASSHFNSEQEGY